MEKKKPLKTLASCKPSEFLRQTNRIRHAAKSWLKATDIMTLWKQMPQETDEHKVTAEEQARVNIDAILDSIMEKHPTETLDLLALMCFVEPEDVDDHTVPEYLAAVTEMIGNPEVLSFFTSLMRLGQTFGSQG